MKTWFFFDAICVMADVLNVFPVLFDIHPFADDAGHISRGIRILKFHRFVRVLLMVRMLRIHRSSAPAVALRSLFVCVCMCVCVCVRGAGGEGGEERKEGSREGALWLRYKQTSHNPLVTSWTSM